MVHKLIKGKKIQGLSSARERLCKRDIEKCLWDLNIDPQMAVLEVVARCRGLKRNVC